ncbi:MAG: hypothetical protein ACE5PO_05415 [Candidatus Bathyarchaeia archaeon]
MSELNPLLLVLDLYLLAVMALLLGAVVVIIRRLTFKFAKNTMFFPFLIAALVFTATYSLHLYIDLTQQLNLRVVEGFTFAGGGLLMAAGFIIYLRSLKKSNPSKTST